MSDRETRALERLAAAGDLDAQGRLDRALVRSGAVARLEAEVDAALARLQRPGDDGPCRGTLHRLDVALALRSLLEDDPSAARAEARRRLRLGAPAGTERPASFAVVGPEGDDALIALGRGAPAALARDLPRATGLDLAALEAVAEPGRVEVVRAPWTVACAWARSEAVHAQTPLHEVLGHVRLRPAMYFGAADARGALGVVDEVLAIGAAEALAGHASTLRVTLHADGSCSVRDDGRAAADRDPAPVSAPASPLPGPARRAGARVGLTPAAAVCEWLELTSLEGGRARVRRHERGFPVGEEVDRAEPGRGLRVRFRLDPAIFGAAADLRLDRVERRARELAHLIAGLRVEVVDEASGAVAAHHAPTGLADWLAEAVPDHPPARALGRRQDPQHGDLRVEAALAWSPDPRQAERRFFEQWPLTRRRSVGPRLAGYVNGDPTPAGGDHVAGLHEGAAAGFDVLGVDTDAAAWRDGLVGVISATGDDLDRRGSTRDRLDAPRVREFVASLVQSAVRAWAREHPGLLDEMRRAAGTRERRRARPRR
ncbi:MAG: hypothetical protein M9894_04120 [Planctomycetes bacterium]|nr:hypothetical protein [Planctomycetota bacterium]